MFFQLIFFVKTQIFVLGLKQNKPEYCTIIFDEAVSKLSLQNGDKSIKNVSHKEIIFHKNNTRPLVILGNTHPQNPSDKDEVSL